MGKTERRMLLQSTKGVTVNLDPDTHRVIKAWAHQEGITIVLVTHEPDVAVQAQRIVRLLDGQVLSDEKVK